MTEQRLIELVHQAAQEEGQFLESFAATEPIPLTSLSWMEFLLLVEEETGRSIDARKVPHAVSVREFREWLEK